MKRFLLFLSVPTPSSTSPPTPKPPDIRGKLDIRKISSILIIRLRLRPNYLLQNSEKCEIISPISEKCLVSSSDRGGLLTSSSLNKRHSSILGTCADRFGGVAQSQKDSISFTSFGSIQIALHSFFCPCCPFLNGDKAEALKERRQDDR